MDIECNYVSDEDDGTEDEIVYDIREDGVAAHSMPKSLLQTQFSSDYMQQIVKLDQPDLAIPKGLNSGKLIYKESDVFPQWIRSQKEWKSSSKKGDERDVPSILRVVYTNRSADETELVNNWLMKIWPTARNLGPKRLAMMAKDFKLQSFKADEAIITEGEAGATFYIIISGETAVMKNGIGKVGQLGKGRTFGEAALESDVPRNASIVCITNVDVLVLHKGDYIRFVKDFRTAEFRENYQLLLSSRVLSTWHNSRVKQLAIVCQRKSLEPNEYLFHQGSNADYLYFILDGGIDIVKEIDVRKINVWPKGVKDWVTDEKRFIRKVTISSLKKGDSFGELAILQDVNRTTAAIASCKTTVVMANKEEFLHLLNFAHRKDFVHLGENAKRYTLDEDVLKRVTDLKGGPTSYVQSGTLLKFPNRLRRTINRVTGHYETDKAPVIVNTADTKEATHDLFADILKKEDERVNMILNINSDKNLKTQLGEVAKAKHKEALRQEAVQATIDKVKAAMESAKAAKAIELEQLKAIADIEALARISMKATHVRRNKRLFKATPQKPLTFEQNKDSNLISVRPKSSDGLQTSKSQPLLANDTDNAFVFSKIQMESVHDPNCKFKPQSLGTTRPLSGHIKEFVHGTVARDRKIASASAAVLQHYEESRGAFVQRTSGSGPVAARPATAAASTSYAASGYSAVAADKQSVIRKSYSAGLTATKVMATPKVLQSPLDSDTRNTKKLARPSSSYL